MTHMCASLVDKGLRSKCPWALEIYGPKQKPGVGAYTEKPFVRIVSIHTHHRTNKNESGRLLVRLR